MRVSAAGMSGHPGPEAWRPPGPCGPAAGGAEAPGIPPGGLAAASGGGAGGEGQLQLGRRRRPDGRWRYWRPMCGATCASSRNSGAHCSSFTCICSISNSNSIAWKRCCNSCWAGWSRAPRPQIRPWSRREDSGREEVGAALGGGARVAAQNVRRRASTHRRRRWSAHISYPLLSAGVPGSTNGHGGGVGERE